MPIYVNKNLIKPVNFPGGECHVTVDSRWVKGTKTQIDAFLYGSDDIMRLLLTVDAVKRICPWTIISVSAPYIPYSRQDKVFNAGEALGIKVIGDLLKSCDISRIDFIDAHSDATGKYLEAGGGHHALPAPLVNNRTIFVCPDAGGVERVKNMVPEQHHSNIIYFEKKRNVSTGSIDHFRTSDFRNIGAIGEDILIIDDICDGGRTFINLSKYLREDGAQHVYLSVAHGIFSEGLDFLRPYIDHVYCNHTWLPEDQRDPSFLTITGEKYV